MSSAHIGEKIKKIRKSYNLSQERFGRRVGISGKTISAYETGKVIPPLKVIERLSDTYEKEIVNSFLAEQESVVDKLQKLEQILRKIENYLFEY